MTCHSDLLSACYAANLTELEAMNKLQNAGIVSDNAVWFHDLSAGDQERAVKWIKDNEL